MRAPAASLAIVFLFCFSVLANCQHAPPSRQALAQVARDWCMTIRACQISPVYPLTEDLQPGDIFLFPNTIEQDLDHFQRKGFLPLDDHLARITPTGYGEFYDNPAFDPHQRNSLQSAPCAVFPSFSFRIQQDSVLNFALPVQGLPVALSALGARSAVVSLALGDVATIGVDHASLFQDVQRWAKKNRDVLEMYAPREPGSPPTHYLRVVRRVFLAQRASIVVTSLGNAELSAQTGPLPGTNPPALAGFLDNSRNLQQAVESSLPHGTIRINWAHSSALGMDQAFARALAVGYLAFDVPIGQGGRLGAGISSQRRIQDKIEFPATSSEFRAPAGLAQEITTWLNCDEVQEHQRIFEKFLESHGVTNSPTYFLNSENAPEKEALMQDFVEQYLAEPAAEEDAGDEI